MINDKLCIDLFYVGDEMINLNHKTTLYKQYKGLKEYLNERFEDTNDTSEVLYRIKHSLNEPEKCCICGNNVKYSKFNKRYNKYCSSKCQNSDPEKIKKDKKSKEEKYGDPHYNNMKKNNETCQKKYGVSHYSKTKDFITKVKDTNLQKYGTEWGLQNTNIRQKSNKTKLKKYGDKNYNNRELAEKTTLKRYGVKNTKQSEIAKNKEKETCLKKYGVTSYTKTNECKEKIKNTFIMKYGVSHNTQSKEWQQKWYSNKDWVNKRNNKIYQTMLSNNSFAFSKTERIILDFLQEKYPDVIYQYSDERYPFKCDFYIPSLDLFIEYNGYWTHGKHPFNPNSKTDLDILEKWENKDNKQYKIAIKVWTETDPLKRNIAKEYNLNFIELWYNDYKYLDLIENKIKEFEN